MPFTLPKIYPITDAAAGISQAEQFRRFVEGGATLIQLREKTAAPREFYEASSAILALAAERKNVKIIINDRADVAFALKADGVHLGQDDLPPEAARRLLGDDSIIGFSTHSIAQAIAAVKLPIDYMAIGPIFATATKRNPDPIVGLEGLKRVRAAIGDFPLVAIGGITLENAGQVFESGADSVAVIGDLLFKPEQIAERVKQFLAL